MQCRLRYDRIIEELGLLPYGFFQPGYLLKRQLTQLDSERRKTSFLKFVQAFQFCKEELLQLYLRILALQRQISQKLGYARITDYLEKERLLVTTVSRSQESDFAHTLRRYFLPLQYELRRQQALRLGKDSLSICDRWFPTPEGLPAPDAANNN
ncbi:MAG: M3 family oligoendopeptidase, partial [Clostridiales bacterium]|nr:M3 family oligoendopeptidase [Clostridiales bacterium]